LGTMRHKVEVIPPAKKWDMMVVSQQILSGAQDGTLYGGLTTDLIPDDELPWLKGDIRFFGGTYEPGHDREAFRSQLDLTYRALAINGMVATIQEIAVHIGQPASGGGVSSRISDLRMPSRGWHHILRRGRDPELDPGEPWEYVYLGHVVARTVTGIHKSILDTLLEFSAMYPGYSPEWRMGWLEWDTVNAMLGPVDEVLVLDLIMDGLVEYAQIGRNAFYRGWAAPDGPDKTNLSRKLYKAQCEEGFRTR